MVARNGYPPGVPCWVDLVQPDLDATMAFYGDLFGWAFEVRTPEAAPQRYAYARLDGLIVAGIGGSPVAGAESAGWTTYVWVTSVDDTAGLVEANGGRVISAPVDIPRAGRVAVCTDPAGAVFGLWQAAENRGAELRQRCPARGTSASSTASIPTRPRPSTRPCSGGCPTRSR